MKIRTRLTLQFILTMVGILGVYSVTALLFTAFNLDNDIETSMHESARQISSQISQLPGGWHALSQQELDRLASADFAVQVQDQNGKELVSSTGWKQQNLPASLI